MALFNAGVGAVPSIASFRTRVGVAAGHVWFGSMLLKKDYEGGLLATLIQDQEQMRNHDSRNHLPGFVRFNF
jgi:hypothetical protein